MVKQTVSLKVLPEDATNKELTCTLSDKSLATINPVTGGVELETKKSGTGELTVESHHGEVTKTVPVNVGETNDILIDGTNGTGSRYVKDLPVNNNYALETGTAKTMTGTGASQLTLNPLYELSDMLLGKQVTISFDLVKSAGATGDKIIISFGGTYQNFATINIDDIPTSVKHYSKSFVISGGNNNSRLYMQTQPSLGPHLNGSVTISNLKIELDNNATPWSPAPEDYGIVHGQPNLLDGTSNEWETITFSGWNAGRMELLIDGTAIKAGDIISYRCEIDATETVATEATSTPLLAYTVVKSDGTTSSSNSGSVLIGTKGVVVGSMAIPEKATSIIFRKAAKNNDTETITVKIRGFKAILGAKTAMDEWTPTQVEFEGKPNLLDGTSDQWVEETFSSYDSSIFPVVPLSTSGLKIGDTLSLSVEIDNTKSISKSRSFISYYNSSGSRLVTNSTGLIDEGKVGVATVTSVIPEGAVSVIVSRVSKHSTGTSTVSTRKHKLIKGTVAELGIWVPKDRTEYDKNLGIIPFTTADYNTLQTADGIVRAETKVVGRGAEIEFKFDVIGTLEKKYPYLFEGITTMAEKIVIYNSIVKNVNAKTNLRGRGIHSATNVATSLSRLFLSWGSNNSTNTSLGIASSSDFSEINANLSTLGISSISNKGYYTLFAATRRNGASDNGAISDGVTPAWVEVKDIRLEVTIQLPEDPNAQPITITIPPS